MARFFQHTYIYDLFFITSKKYAFADDLAILYSSGDWKMLERTWSEDFTTFSAYSRFRLIGPPLNRVTRLIGPNCQEQNPIKDNALR